VGPLFVEAPVRPDVLNMPKSAAAPFTLTPGSTKIRSVQRSLETETDAIVDLLK